MSVYKHMDNSDLGRQISIKSDNLEAATSKAQENATKAVEIADTIAAEFSKTSLLSNITRELTKTIEHESGSFATLGRTINKGKEDMLNRDLIQAKIAEAIQIPTDFDKNDPANIEHKKFDDYLIAIIDQGRGVTEGTGDGTVTKEDKDSGIKSMKVMENVNEKSMPDESVYDEYSTIDKEEILKDEFKPGGTEEQILDEATRVIRKDLKDAFKDGGTEEQILDDKTRVIRTDLRDAFRPGGTKEENYNDKYTINPTLLENITNNDTLDEKEIENIDINQNNNNKSNNNNNSNTRNAETEQAEGINESTLAEVTDALTDLGEVGTGQEIMGNELSKTVDDLTASNIAVTDLAQSIASEVMSNEIGK